MLEDVLYYQLELVKILFLKRAMPLYLLPFLNFYSFMLESFIIKNSLFLSYLCSIVQSCPTLWDPRLLCLWDSPSKNIGYVGSHSVLQGIFPRHQTLISYISCTGRWVLYHQCHPGSNSNMYTTTYKGRQWMRTYYLAQGTVLNDLWWPKWEKNLKQESRYVYV